MASYLLRKEIDPIHPTLQIPECTLCGNRKAASKKIQSSDSIIKKSWPISNILQILHVNNLCFLSSGPCGGGNREGGPEV